MARRAPGPAHRDRHRVVGLRDLDHLVAEHHLGVRQFAEPVEDEPRGLELLALDDEWEARVVLEERMVERGDALARRAVPELDDGTDEPDAGHVLDEAGLGQQLQRRRMRGRGARIVGEAGIVVEHPDGHAPAREQQRGQEPHRPAARDQYPAIVDFPHRATTMPQRRGPRDDPRAG